MKKKIKMFLKRIKYGKKVDSHSYIKYLRKIGIRIGKNTVIYSPQNTTIDVTRPWLIEIGDNVKITKGVTILTHGYDWSVLRYSYNGEVIGSAGKVKIGNNVFVGMNSTILKGVTIGDNVIIGANSLVNKDIPSNVVIAGNPAKIIMSIEQYYNKRKESLINEAKNMSLEYKKVYGVYPPIDIYYEYFPLFVNKNNITKYEDKISFKFDDDIGDDIRNHLLNNTSKYNSYEEMISDFFCKEKI